MDIDLLALAPCSLRNHRLRRYQADDMCLSMSAFVATDQARLRSLYDFLRQLLALFGEAGPHAEGTLERLRSAMTLDTLLPLIRDIQQLGYDSAETNPSELFKKTVHDLRSGGLSLLLARLQFALASGWTPESVRAVYYLTRDHLKTMRNALRGLDEVNRARDRQPRLHGTQLILEKWQDALLVRDGVQTRLRVESSFDGYLSESCVEFSALDRSLYNLINNACRHTADHLIELHLLRLPRENVRFVLINRLTKSEREQLSHRDLSELFQPAVSTTNSGFGLTVVADFVTNAYGLGRREDALEGGYVGAKVVGDQFLAWFHWPIAQEL